MKKLIFVDFHNEKRPLNYLDSILFLNEYSYKNFIYNIDSNVHVFDTLIFEIKGSNYREKKNCLEDIAQNFYCMFMDCGISQKDYSIIQNWFTEKARMYGLTNKFRENAII